ncbi:SufI multicopper oxidase [Pyrenophora tritici-repentis]|uniref:Laccase-1 n=2 Tax=Pyrenophora tritici-repentis TaxID=45151 RepID=A0A2W1GJL2_9PLEO|nr:laccase-1 precursor [Pyrenophora tritici-repentis Pt-1C-BFP]KAA8624853.1 hypothetical protein PtrV1_00533 [Pyrenophora tritici-repentis]EDU39703.1 laccase-1 precursor [Pyrenophora tritici-repentis Pt-1C-BFP]KAF7453249.1 laccase-1 [Pyrenophora tritici-repentis]KAF7576311.1 SufI, putative multicopper oxidase [Pyrenophora tritici-repentis]KAG9377297.1 laccase-1 [Pyrenophora tritici-repentis]
MVNSSVITKLFAGTIPFQPALPQSQTNGLSNWGTLDAPLLNNWIDRGHGNPWGGRNCWNSNPYIDAPHTGQTVKVDWTLERKPLSPDGYSKNVLLVNGQFPGPLLEANWGDMIEVTIHNKIAGPVEGTAMHFHGFTMKDTPWMDGVPSVSQCPIAPGETFTYKFKADLYGTSWYHSHYSGQQIGGLMGPVVVHGPASEGHEIDLGPVFINDWWHKDYLELIDDAVGTNQTLWRPWADNNMINGKMDFDCTTITDGRPCVSNAGLSKFRFRAGKTHRLRLVNSGAASLQHFSIDGHEMTVIANDFVPVKPYNTDVITLGVGQRTDILVKAKKDRKGAFWMRSMISDLCAASHQPLALAAIYYDQADERQRPNSTAHPITDVYHTCINDPLEKTEPSYPIAVKQNPTSIINLDYDRVINATGHQTWTVNDSAFRANYNNPILELVKNRNTSYPTHPEWNVHNMGQNKTVRIIMYNKSNNTHHPMHLHGHNMQVLSEGPGRWDGHTIVRPQNPHRRDVHQLRASGHLVIQYEQDNPGVWSLHCHVAWHVSTGMFSSLIERPQDVAKMNFPAQNKNTCRAWDKYSSQNVVDQVDSGV